MYFGQILILTYYKSILIFVIAYQIVTEAFYTGLKLLKLSIAKIFIL